MALSAGTVLKSYEILAPLGAGGMGEVYRARDRKLGREIAVKVLPERLASDAEARTRFEREAVDYAAQIARGLAAAHARGVVHRDLKPENLFVTTDGYIKILDFGLARRTSPESDMTNADTLAALTEPGVVLGTVGYMSPEQVRGQPADARSDIFSFGAVLFEMLSGFRPFRRDSPAET